MLALQSVIFLYDKHLIAPSSTSSVEDVVAPSPALTSLIIDSAPEPLSTPTDIREWQALFQARRDWALNLLEKTRSVAHQAQENCKAIPIIQRGLGVALGNLQAHIQALQQRHQDAHVWAEQTGKEQDSLLSALDAVEPLLQSLPLQPGFRRFFPTGRQGDASDELETRKPSNLVDLVEATAVDVAVQNLERAQKNILNLMRQLDEQVGRVVKTASGLVSAVGQTQDPSVDTYERNVSQLFEEVEVLAQKIGSDLEHLQSLDAKPNSAAQASKMALLHSRNYLPSLQECCTELKGLAQESAERKTSAVTEAIGFMRRIAATEATFAQVNNQLLQLDVTAECGDAFDHIDLVTQIPLTYGMLLVEAVRRKEWADKVKNESAVLAEDIAAYREEEERRRRKWFKGVGPVVVQNGATLGKALYFEVNMKSDEPEWPNVTRDDVSAYLKALAPVAGTEEISARVSEAFKDLDLPTKRQLKKAKSFKMGSVHEASMSRGGSLLLRENDELKILRDLNHTLENELKGHRARVRRLEEMVTKPAAPRLSSDNIHEDGAISETYGSSPRMTSEFVSRKASLSTRRMSNKPGDDQVLVRRIVSLEAELVEERTRRQEAERRAGANKEADAILRKEVEDSRSTHKDLMENMEAQQREFSGERRMLEEELSKQKIKVEEFEDELDRILGSRDNEKIGADRKVRAFESELEETRQALTSLVEEARRREEDQYGQSKVPQHAIYSLLPAEDPLPTTLCGLVSSLEGLTERSARHAETLAQALATVRSENESLQMLLERREKEALDTQEQLRDLEEAASTTRNDAAAEKARAGALATELEDGRAQLRILRAKFAEGETGSDSLRQRLEEQAARAGDLAAKLAEAKSHVNSLDIELSSLQRRHNKLQTSHLGIAGRLEQRSARDKELTNRLVARNEDLARLLDSLGLSVTYRDGAFAVQRTSKMQSASTSFIDPTSPSPTTAQQSPLPSTFDVTPSSATLQWMHAATAEEESTKFTLLLSQLDTLHVATVSEAIIKLRRDVEWTGKKWKNEARNYRDRYHKAKTDGHDKIAFRAFKEGDLALFLPTKNQATRPWAAFNVGAPHYFLREQDSHRLHNREWLVARISKMQERVVDLSKTIDSLKAGDGRSIGEASDGLSYDDDNDNPFELSDGLRWYLLDAAEEKLGAPATPGPGKTTVASANVDARGSIRLKKLPAGSDASGTLNRSLDESRRSSTHSKRESVSGVSVRAGDGGPQDDGVGAGAIDIRRQRSTQQLRPGSHQSSSTTTSGPGGGGLAIEVRPRHQRSEEVRNDLLWGP